MPRSLDFSDGKASFEEIIAEISKQDPEVAGLDLSGRSDIANFLFMPGLVEALNSNPYIKFLNFSKSGLDDFSVGALKGLRNIININVSDNFIQTIGSVPFAQNKFFREVNISNNPIGQSGGECFASKKAGHRIVNLNTDGCCIPADILDQIQKRLDENARKSPLPQIERPEGAAFNERVRVNWV